MIVSHEKKFVFLRPPKTASTTAELMIRIGGGIDINEAWISEGGGLPSTVPQEIWDRVHAAADEESHRRIAALGQTVSEEERQLGVTAIAHTWMSHMDCSDLVSFGILTEDQLLNEYYVTAFIRNPDDRYMSSYSHAMGPRVLPEHFLEGVRDKNPDNLGLLAKSQGDYHVYKDSIVTQPMLFDNFHEELSTLIVNLGGHHFKEFPRLNSSANRFLKTMDKDLYLTPEVKSLFRQYWPNEYALYDQIVAWKNRGNS